MKFKLINKGLQLDAAHASKERFDKQKFNSPWMLPICVEALQKLISKGS